jgi:UDPglucose 6-dehydrogenase
LYISIIGSGFLGKAIWHAFSSKINVRVYDKFLEGYDNISDTVKDSRIIFLCLPTPTNDDGTQDISVIEGSVKELSKFAGENQKIFVIKSTVLPGTNRKLQEKYPNHIFISNPEFLTERLAKFDFLNQHRIVLGGENEDALEEIRKLYRVRFPHTPIHIYTWEEAESIKYICNCFFAAKISFMNNVYDICSKLNINFENIRKGLLGDLRVGNSHTEVPGPDGKFGFGGHCFPKDLKAFTKFCLDMNIDMTMFEATDRENKIVRKEE